MYIVLALMTTKQTLQALRKANKAVSLTHLYRLFRKLDIQPLGRSRPQLYPPETVDRILSHLGVSSVDARRFPSVPLPDWVKESNGQKLVKKQFPSVPLPDWVKELNREKPIKKLITVAQLRAAKPKTKGTK